MSRIRAVSSGTEYPRPRLPKEPKNERSLRTCADVVAPRRASSAEETVVWPCASNCSRNRRYRESRRTVLSEIFRIFVKLRPRVLSRPVVCQAVLQLLVNLFTFVCNPSNSWPLMQDRDVVSVPSPRACRDAAEQGTSRTKSESSSGASEPEPSDATRDRSVEGVVPKAAPRGWTLTAGCFHDILERPVRRGAAGGNVHACLAI